MLQSHLFIILSSTFVYCLNNIQLIDYTNILYMKFLKKFSSSLTTMILFTIIVVAFSNTHKAFGQFVQIESILVDACDGTDEGKNEMVRFRTESLPVNVADIRVDGANSGAFSTGKWPTIGNSFSGWITPGTANHNTVITKINQINSTIINCGKLILPTGGTNNQGIIPAGKKAIIITSYDFTATANDFSLLSDTIYVVVHNASVVSGNFGNYLTASGNSASQLTRKLRLWQVSTGLNDEVTYFRNLLVDQLGVPGTADGAGVRYTDAGAATYYNDGCQAPYIPLSAEWTTTSICQYATAINLNTLLTADATTGGTWSGNGVTGNSFDPAGLSGSINVTYTVGTAPCTIFETHAITITASATPTWTAPSPICQSGSSLNLNTLLDATATTGGTWSGTGVTGTNFNPAGLTGNISITYTVGTSPCISTENHNINVITSANATWTPPASICQSATAVDLNTLLAPTATTGGTWSGTGVTGNTFSPAGLSGNISVTYTVGTAPCTATLSKNFNVISSAIPTWVAPSPICQSGSSLNLNTLLAGAATTGGTWSGTGVTGNTFNPAGLLGNISVTYTVGTSPCTSTETHNINVITAANATWNAPSPICESAAAIDLNTLLTAAATTGGTWSGNGVSGNNFDPSGLSGNISVTYTVGTAPCTATISHDISIIASAIPTWTAPSAICQSASSINLNTLLAATATTGGTWSGNGVTGNTFNPSGLNGNISVTYTVGASPCISTESHNIPVTLAPTASLNIPAVICKTTSTFDLNTLITGTPGGTWSGVGVSSNIINLNTVGNSLSITYTISDAGCSDSITAVLVFSSVVADFTFTPDNGLAPLSVTTINSSQNASSYLWNFGNGETSGDVNTSTIYNYEGTYIISLKATSIEGCVDSISKTVTIISTGDYIPNVFTPNEDGVNDSFYPVISKLTEDYHMMIFNRWGNLIFETFDQNGKWDGTYSGSKVPFGVYFYVITFKHGSNNIYYNGTVSAVY